MPIPRIRQPVKTRETDPSPVNSLQRLNVPSQESSGNRSKNTNPNLAKSDERGVKRKIDNSMNQTNTARHSLSNRFPEHTQMSNHIPAKIPLAAPSSEPTEKLSKGPRLPKNQRPVFPTLQQHYIPRKAPKALTTSILEAPRQNDNLASEGQSKDIIQLQRDLAQLHLLHYQSGKIHTQWQRSAEHCLQTRFDRLATKHIEIHRLSNHCRQMFNHSMFAQWCEKCTSTEITERITILSQALNDLTSMISNEGKFMVAVSSFRSWISLAIEIRETRDSSGREGDDTYFIEKLNKDWQSEVQTLVRKLQSIIRRLDSLGKPGAGSALHQTLNLAKILAVNMLEELNKIRAIEQQILAQEVHWINDTIKALASEDQEDFDGSFNSVYQGIWNT
ncbi:MAG: hypothetical protein Q9167_002474 [Letrouitia subvulpina]